MGGKRTLTAPAAFRLTVSPEGRVTGCSIQSSSGSATLDHATCAIMTPRARFKPARDAQGKPVADEVVQRIVWRLEEVDTPRKTQAAVMLWTSCTTGEAAKLAFTDLSATDIASRSFPPCVSLETVLAREINGTVPLTEQRAKVSELIERGLIDIRSAFESHPRP